MLKKVAALNIQINESGECELISDDAHYLDNVAILHQAAGILRNAMSGITFQTSHYSPSAELNLQQCKTLVPEALYDFVAQARRKVFAIGAAN